MTKPVVFVHGLWLHATSWAPMDRAFERRGTNRSLRAGPNEASTVEEPGPSRAAVANQGIDDVTTHYAAIIEALDEPPS